MEMIELRNVWKSYPSGDGEVPVLKDISFKVGKAERTAITGPSGCGKSTLLNIMSGLDTADKGSVLVEGDELGRKSAKELSALRLKKFGFVFQAFHLIPTLNVLDNILLPVTANHQKPDMEDINHLCEVLGIRERMKHFPGQLSGGEMQRVAIARAIVHKPDILFCDEATGNLDAENSLQVMELITNCCREYQLTWIFVTHDSSLLRFADRVYRLSGDAIKETEDREG